MEKIAKIYYEEDADLQFLRGKTVAVLGYGSQGHAQAQNLRDSGVDVVVGLRRGRVSWNLAREHGLRVATVAEAAAQAHVIHFLLPDQDQARVYREEVAGALRPGVAISFSHGFNIHYGQIVPPGDVDVFMVAPKSPGHLVRRVYTEGGGVPGLLAVHQDATGDCRGIGLAFAKGIGCTRAGVLETTFKEETETDLFGEQTVLCGGVSALIKAGYETLVEAGYQPESAYFECLHELKLIVDLIYEGGLSWMRYSVSDTAKYGDVTVGPRVVGREAKEAMRVALERIQNGEFAREWILENQAGKPVFNALLRREAEHPIEAVGKELRGMMSWLKKPKG